MAAVAPTPLPEASKKEPEVPPMSEDLVSSTGEKRTPETYSTRWPRRGVLITGGRASRERWERWGSIRSFRLPDYQVNPKPPYPLIARRIGAQGEVLLRVLVRQDGSVAAVELAQSSGFWLFSLMNPRRAPCVKIGGLFLHNMTGSLWEVGWKSLLGLSWPIHEHASPP